MMKRIMLMPAFSICLITLSGLFSYAGSTEEQKKAEPQGEDNLRIVKPVEIPVYKPPVRGAPGGRVGGGSRGDSQTFQLSVLAPSHTGQTIHEQPVLFWYVSKALTSPIEFTLVESGVIPP